MLENSGRRAELAVHRHVCRQKSTIAQEAQKRLLWVLGGADGQRRDGIGQRSTIEADEQLTRCVHVVVGERLGGHGRHLLARALLEALRQLHRAQLLELGRAVGLE